MAYRHARLLLTLKRREVKVAFATRPQPISDLFSIGSPCGLRPMRRCAENTTHVGTICIHQVKVVNPIAIRHKKQLGTCRRPDRVDIIGAVLADVHLLCPIGMHQINLAIAIAIRTKSDFGRRGSFCHHLINAKGPHYPA